MLTSCAECTRLWRIYHAATVEEIRAYEKLAGAKLKAGNPELIAALSAHANTLSLLVTATSIQVAEHRAIHGSARQPSLQSGILQSVVQSSMPPRCPECVRLWDIYYEVSVEEFRAHEDLETAKLQNVNVSLIGELSSIAVALERDLDLASEQVSSHRATHRPGASRKIG
jgi:hypothetical protein